MSLTALPARAPGRAGWLAAYGGAGPVLAYLALCFIWGSTYLAIRLAVETIPPQIMVGTRSVLAGSVMLAVALARGARLPARRDLGPALLCGLLLFVGGQSMLAVGERHIASGQAAVLGATQAILMPLAAWAIGAAVAPRLTAWLGLLAGFAGVVILVRPGSHALDPLGAGATLASVLLWSLGGAMAKRFPLNGVAMTSGVHMILGGLACLLIALVAGEFDGFTLAQVSGASWRGFLYLATFGSLAGFTAFAWLVQIWPPERLATYTYVNPIVALVLGTALAGEALSTRDLAATLVILGAVGIVMWGGRRA